MWMRLRTNSSATGSTRTSHTSITIICVVISSVFVLIKIAIRAIGRRPGADNMFMERVSSNTRPPDATIYLWKQYLMRQPLQNRNGLPNGSGGKSLEPHSRTDDSPSSRAVLEAQLRECFGRVVYSHKTHEKCADILLSRLSRIKLWQIVLSAVTTGGFIAAVFGAGQIGAVIGIIISTTLLVLSAYTKSYDLGELAQKHRQAGVNLWLMREKYLSLITDLRMGEKPIETLQTERDELLEQLHSVYSGAPSTNYQAYRKAQESLKKLEELTFSDDEIDAFLPKELRKG